MLDKRDWAERHAGHLRRILLLEPRGHRDMCGALLTEPVSPGSHAGILFMHNDGFGGASAHGIIATTVIALTRGLLMPGGPGDDVETARQVVYDTPAGTIRARAIPRAGMAAQSVSFLNVPSFVLFGGLEVTLASLGNRQIRADVAFGGAFYAVVDSEAAGLRLDASHLPELRRVGMEITRTIETSHRVEHPLEPRLAGIDGTIFTGPSTSEGADLRSVTVFANAEVDRSPCGTGLCAIMAVLSAMGLLSDETKFECEGLIGTRLSGRATGRSAVAEHDAIVPEIQGSAWVTGEHTFFVDEADPLREGFLV